MSNSLARTDHPQSIQEVKRQLITVDKTTADVITRRLDIEERQHELNEAIKRDEAKRLAELRQLKKEARELADQQKEIIGGRKVLLGLLKRFGVDTPVTKLTTLVQKNEDARELIEA